MSCSTTNTRSETEVLPLDSIEIPKGHRAAKKSKVQELADSIKADGLLQPIGVRKHPDKPGSYVLVFGRHRLEAARCLKWIQIEARVLDMDDRSAWSATLAENLFRNPLKKSEYLLALKQWNDYYKEKFPETTEHRAGGKARGLQRRAEARGEVISNAEALVSVPTFTEHAAKLLGVSPGKVRRDIRAANAIGEAGLQTLIDREVPPETIRQIVRLEQPEHRDKAVGFIRSGMEPKLAIAVALAPENATLTTVEQHNDPNYLPEEQMNDEEWLTRMCSDALGRLKFQARFRRDAILYRKTREALAHFRKQAKKAMATTRGERPGPLYHKITAIFNLPHPNNWPACGACGGTGQSPEESPCTFCYGHAYSIRMRR